MTSKHECSIGLAYGQIATCNQAFPAIVREQHILTHAAFWQVVRSFAFRMRDHGVTVGSLVALNTRDMLVSLAALLASSLLGSRFVVAGPVLAKAQVLHPTHFFRSPEVVGSKKVKFYEIDDSWFPTSATQALPDNFLGAPDPDADWLYLHTSGTTGQPKFIALSERIVWDRTTAVAADFPFRRTTLASIFSPTSRPFFARAIGTLLNAGAIVDSTDLSFWSKAGVNLVCGSPRQITGFLNGRVINPRLARLEVSGAKLMEEAAGAFLESFDRVIDVYGAGETSKTFVNEITRGPDGRIVATGQKLDSSVEVVSASGHLCQTGEVGSVRIRNGYMVRGYLNSPDDTNKSFREGWFYPGDIATWGENGDLVIVSRDDDVINLGGYKLNATMLDMFFCSIPGIREAISFRNPKPDAVDRILVFVVFDKLVDRATVIYAACQIAERRLNLTLMPRSIRAVDIIPRTDDGAPDRATCQMMVKQRAGLLDGLEE